MDIILDYPVTALMRDIGNLCSAFPSKGGGSKAECFVLALLEDTDSIMGEFYFV